jgi:hypothetical protein
LCGQNNHQSQRRCLGMQQPHALFNTTLTITTKQNNNTTRLRLPKRGSTTPEIRCSELLLNTGPA